MRSLDYRHWMLTWTTYGSWIPGDARGSTSYTHSPGEIRKMNNRPGTMPAPSNKSLENYSHEIRKHPVVFLNRSMAEIVAEQLRETAEWRGWQLLIVSIMTTHIHLVLQVPGDPKPSQLLKDLKSYASRRLNQYDPNRSGRWWTDSGSARFLYDDSDIMSAFEYVRNQPNSLLVCEK